MKCPKCNSENIKVIDKRVSVDGTNRRRRECNDCGSRFTTYETIELENKFNKITQVKKRDGTVVLFDQKRITNAIFKAARAVGGHDRKTAEKLTEDVVELLNKKHEGEIPGIEDIQNVVEKVLIESGHAKVAKAYILYRDAHKKIRDKEAVFLEIGKTMDEYLGKSDWRVKENSNSGFSVGGLILYASGKITANYWLNNIYPKEVKEAHMNGDLHIHDLSMFTGYCAGWSLKQLLEEGFGGVAGQLKTVPPKHFDTVIGQVVNFLGTMQNEWAGAQALSSFDTYLAPFVKKDNLDFKFVKQKMQNLLFNLATPSRWGTQTPFLNFTFDWVVPEDMKNKKAIIAGKEEDFTYGDCQKEMDIINKAFIICMTEGDASGRVFTFPIPTYNITRDFDWDSENADLLFEMTAKYGIPYFQNFVNSDLKPSDVRSMCCRLQLDLRELRKKTGGLFGSGENTGSIGVITINLPRIGYLSKTKEEFFEKLKELMDIGKLSLEIKREVMNKQIENGLLPYTKRYLGNLNHHFSTIGLNGMNEASLNFLNKDIATEEGKKFAEDVLEFMREKIAGYQEETGNIYNLEATPAEGTSYRFAKMDKERYPNIITAGAGEPYYTNSSLLPVNFTDDIFEVFDHQDSLQTKYTGGCIEKGNKVLTDKGLLNIEYLIKNFKELKPIKALSHNPEKGISEWDEIIDAMSIDVKERDKIRIKGERNLDITTSDWHPFFVSEKIKINPSCPICRKKVKNKKAFAAHLRHYKKCRIKYKKMSKYETVEKRADDLKVGDYILQNSSNLYPNKLTKLNKDIMWLIGFFIGDGCISKFIDNRGGNRLEKYKIRFHSEHAVALEKVRRILLKYFNVKVNVIKNDKRSEKLREISTSKRDVLEFFFKYGFNPGKKVYKINIPKKVKNNLTKNNVFSLLSGLADSDGHIDKRDGSFEYYTVSPQLADDILEICSCAGIMINKKERFTKRKNEVSIYRLRIPQYQMTKIKNKLDLTFNLSRIKDNLSNRKKRHFPIIRTKEISKVGVKDNQFYDLTTKNNHNYLAGKNSLVFIHNTVVHGFLGERISDSETCKALVKKIAYNYRLPYYTISPTFSICEDHGYLNGEVKTCPKCNKVTEVYSRVVGYLRPVSYWNEGKREEFGERKVFSPKHFDKEIESHALVKPLVTS